MYYTLQQRLGHVLRAILAWMVAYSIFGVFRFYGIGELPHVETTAMINPEALAFQLFLAAVVTGFLYGSVDILLDRPVVQRMSYGMILAMRIASHFTIILVVLVTLLYSRVSLRFFNEGYLDPQMPRNPEQIIFNKSFFVFVLFFAVVSIILDFYQQVKHKFGRGVLFDMFMGRYHKPKESERIFAFIDLKSSVSLAEQLGHIQYSNLIQDCFFDLNTQLSRYNAKIYQYVGDQVVLHWNMRDGVHRNNCIHCFFGFLERLEKRRSYYEQKYGLLPFFKAGVHTGRVTVAEVGLLKREIAFHGDTVNTTSRIHDYCNKYQQRMLISKNLHDLLIPDPSLEFLYIGDHVLKGKHISMELYGVRRHTVTRTVPAKKSVAPEEPSVTVSGNIVRG